MTDIETVPAYALAYLRDVDLNEQVMGYIGRLDATLDEFGGRFLVHGGRPRPPEGEWTGDVVIVQFPNRQAALDWYAPPGYQTILPLRTENSNSIATVVDGVPADYRATDMLKMPPEDNIEVGWPSPAQRSRP